MTTDDGGVPSGAGAWSRLQDRETRFSGRCHGAKNALGEEIDVLAAMLCHASVVVVAVVIIIWCISASHAALSGLDLERRVVGENSTSKDA